MKKKLIYPILAVTALALVVVSCKKDDDANPSTNSPAKTPMLTANDWILNDLAFDVNSNNKIDVGESVYNVILEDCMKDNIHKYTSNLNFTLNEGTDICSGEPQSTSGTWKFTDNESNLIVSLSTSTPDTFKIISMTSGSWQGSTRVSGATYRAIWDYKKK